MKIESTHIKLILVFAVFLWSNFSALGQCNSPVVFNSPGDNTFFVPAGVNSLVVEVWGAGAGGAGRTTNGTGGGGGGGAYSRSELIVVPGTVYTVYVGHGGASNANGQDSWVSLSDAITNMIVLAKGGQSPGNNIVEGGLGGASANGIGNIRFNGGNGADGISNRAGGGGSSAGVGIDGNSAIDQNGAAAPVGGGPGGNGASNNNQDGNSPVSAPGGGGGGARGANQNGGAGSNGRVRITYTCQFFVGGTLLDDGAITGTTIIEFSSSGLNKWTAPKGLTEFELFVVGGGGGGGYGNAAGGGGAGGVTIASFNGINGGQGFAVDTEFEMNVGGGGGAGNENTKGSNGTLSIFGQGTDFQTVAGGGGGGGSNLNANGRDGFSTNASGGGASGTNIAGLGNTLGNDGSSGLNSDTGGGGGGAGSPGTPGTYDPDTDSNFIATGGNGGEGFSSDFRGNNVIYSAGGGGTTNAGSNSPRNIAGLGGSGVGGNANNSGIGGMGRSLGSGGGAGSNGGGSGNSGVVIIRYPNFRILPVEYLYFDALFREETKTVELKWATAKEWENSHFEIHRSLQDIKNWELIGNEPGYGWSDNSVEYMYSDHNLPLIGGIAYYRLKQVDFNDNFEFSKTVSVRLPSLNQVKGVWKAFPNPNVGEIFSLELIDEKEYFGEELRVRFISPFSSNKVIAGTNLRQISGSILEVLRKASNGIYILEISWGQKVEFIKIMKQ